MDALGRIHHHSRSAEDMTVIAHFVSGEGDVITARTVSPFPPISPERALMLGVIRQALNDYLIPDVSSRHRARIQFEAASWIYSEKTEPWTFIDDCLSMGLDYKLMRRRLQEIVIQQRKLRRRRLERPVIERPKHVRN